MQISILRWSSSRQAAYISKRSQHPVRSLSTTTCQLSGSRDQVKRSEVKPTGWNSERKPNRWNQQEAPSDSSSTFKNLVGYRRRNNLTELPKLESKQRKKGKESDRNSLLGRIRFNQKNLNSNLTRIHEEMKSNLKYDSIYKRDRSYGDEERQESMEKNLLLWENALDLFTSSPKPFQRDFRVYNQMIAMAFKAGKHKAAMDLVMQFKKLALTPSLSTFTTVFTGLTQKYPPLSSSNQMFTRTRNFFSELETMRMNAFDPNHDPLSQEQDLEESDEFEMNEIHLPDEPQIEEVSSSKKETISATKELRSRSLKMTLEHFRLDREGLIGAYASYLRLLLTIGEEKEANDLFDRLAIESFKFRSEDDSKRRKVMSHQREISSLKSSKSRNWSDIEGEEREYTFLPPYPHIALFTVMLKAKDLKVERFLELLEMWKTIDDMLEKEIGDYSGAQKDLEVFIEERKMIQFDPIAMASVLFFLGRSDIRMELQKALKLEHHQVISKIFENHFFQNQQVLEDVSSQDGMNFIHDSSPSMKERPDQRRRSFSRGIQFTFPSTSQLSRILHVFSNARRSDLVLRLMNQLDFSQGNQKASKQNLVLDDRHLTQVLKACASLKGCQSALDWIRKGSKLNLGHEAYSHAMKACSVVELSELNKGLEDADEIWKIWRNNSKLFDRQHQLNLDGKEGKAEDGDKEMNSARRIIKSYLVTLHRARNSHRNPSVPLSQDSSLSSSEKDTKDSVILETREHLKSILEIYPISSGDGMKWIKNLIETERDTGAKSKARSKSEEELTLICRMVRSLTDVALMSTGQEVQKVEEIEESKPRVGKYDKGKDKYGRDRKLQKVARSAHEFWILNKAARASLGARKSN